MRWRESREWTDLVQHAVPGVAGVVDDDVQLAAAELGGLLDEALEVVVVEHVTHDRQGAAAVGVDLVGDLARLLAVNVGDHDLSGSRQREARWRGF